MRGQSTTYLMIPISNICNNMKNYTENHEVHHYTRSRAAFLDPTTSSGSLSLNRALGTTGRGGGGGTVRVACRGVIS